MMSRPFCHVLATIEVLKVILSFLDIIRNPERSLSQGTAQLCTSVSALPEVPSPTVWVLFASLAFFKLSSSCFCLFFFGSIAPDDTLDTEDENADPSFNLDTSMKSDVDHLAENFCEDLVSHLEQDDRVLLGLFLCFQLTKNLDLLLHHSMLKLVSLLLASGASLHLTFLCVGRKKRHMLTVVNVMMWSNTTSSFVEAWFPLGFSM